MNVCALVLRPQPGAQRTADALVGMGIHPLIHPLFVVRPRPWSLADNHHYDAVAVTSANAIRHGGPSLDALLHLPLFAVGEATARAAMAYGFKTVQMGEGDAADLARLLEQTGYRTILHLCGADHRPFAVAGASVDHRCVYESLPQEPSDGFAKDVALARLALVHSPRSAARLAEVLASLKLAREHLTLVAISANAADAAGKGWREVAIATKKSDEAMLALAAGLVDRHREGN